MLSWQDCIDMCDLAPEEECVVRGYMSVSELGAVVLAHERLLRPAGGCQHFHLLHVPEALKQGDIFTYRLPPSATPHFGHARHS